MAKPVQLTTKTVAILGVVAHTRSYKDLQAAHPALTFREIAEAAQEVITRLVEGKSRMDEIREKYPRAYMKWTDEDDALLEDLLRQGEFVSKIAKALERGRPGIRSRIMKLGLVELMHPEDRAELEGERGRYNNPRTQLSHAEVNGGAQQSGAKGGSELGGTGPSPVEQGGQTAAQRMRHPLARREPVSVGSQ